MRITTPAACLAAMTLLALPSGSAAEGATTHAGFFTSGCAPSHAAADDPIVKPRLPGAAHLHDFFGNRGTDAHSTLRSLLAGTTLCRREGDLSAYWVPSLIRDGRRVPPRFANVYYRTAGRRPTSVRPFPAGLRVVAGQAGADGAQAARVTQWGCTRGPGRRAKLLRPSVGPPVCPRGTRLRMVVRFPDCWDGRRLDSRDHSSHLAYTPRSRGTRACPRSHPLAVPTLGLDVSYPIRSARGARLSSGALHTVHADFFNAWRPEALRSLVRRCLHGAARCGNR
jgi:hypothetical protein